MNSTAFLVIISLFLFAFSIIDIKFKQIPSGMLTGLLIVTLFNRTDYLVFGVLALLYALFLYEFGFISGVADIKLIALFGLLVDGLLSIMVLMLIVACVGLLYKVFFKTILKKKHEIAFIPSLSISFLIMWVLGVLL